MCTYMLTIISSFCENIVNIERNEVHLMTHLYGEIAKTIVGRYSILNRQK
jgi:hypothetical protein